MPFDTPTRSAAEQQGGRKAARSRPQPEGLGEDAAERVGEGGGVLQDDEKHRQYVQRREQRHQKRVDRGDAAAAVENHERQQQRQQRGAEQGLRAHARKDVGDGV